MINSVFAKIKLRKGLFFLSIVIILLVILFIKRDYILDNVARIIFLPEKGIRKGTYQVKIERSLGFKTADDIVLAATVYHPKGILKSPTILVRIPFSRTFMNTLRSDIIGRYWASRGYTVVIQGTRGRYQSGGEFYPLINERQDGIQTIEWLSQQPWYNKQIVMWGGSSFGHTQWVLIDNPSIKGYFIQISSTNFHDMFFPGNAFSLESALYWTIKSRGNQDRDVNMADLERGVQSLPVIDADEIAIGDTNFYNDWLLQKDDRTYWDRIDSENRLQQLNAPVLLMAGWYDPFLVSQLKDFETIQALERNRETKHSHLIIGPWAHAAEVKLPNSNLKIPYRKTSLEFSIPWFDYLVGYSTKFELPPVKIFVMGINEWRDELNWPILRTQYTPFYLHSEIGANSLQGDGRLNNIKPKADEIEDKYSYDPLDPVPSLGGAILSERAGIMPQNDVEQRNDVLVYSTRPLAEPIEVTGSIQVVLYVKTDAPSTDFTAKLVDVYPDGRAYNLSDGILRREYKNDAGPHRIEIELNPTSNVFLEDHQIRIEISSSHFPRYDRNLNTGDISPTAQTSRLAHQTIYHSNNYPSHIILPIIPT